MSRFNTGNPIDSNDPRDLSDNAKNLDQGINSNDLTFTDRLGNSRQSWAGMESEFQADQGERKQRFNTFIASSGYDFVGDYDADIELTEYNQVVRDSNGEFWRVSGSQSLPYTTTGAGLPEGGAFVTVGDAALRQELDGDVANGQGARLVRGAVIYVDTVADLQALDTSGLVEGQAASVQGSEFRWTSSTDLNDDGGLVFNGSSGRWVRQVPDGVVTDSYFVSPEVAEVIGSAKALGYSKVRFLNDYSISEELDFDASGLSLEFLGKIDVSANDYDDGFSVKITGENFCIRGLYINYLGSGNVAGVLFDGCSNFAISELVAKNFGDSGARVDGCGSGRFSELSFTNNHSHPDSSFGGNIRVHNSTNIIVDTVECDNTYGKGVTFSSSFRCALSNLVCNNFQGDNGIAFYTTQSADIVVSNVTTGDGLWTGFKISRGSRRVNVSNVNVKGRKRGCHIHGVRDVIVTGSRMQSYEVTGPAVQFTYHETTDTNVENIKFSGCRLIKTFNNNAFDESFIFDDTGENEKHKNIEFDGCSFRTTGTSPGLVVRSAENVIVRSSTLISRQGAVVDIKENCDSVYFFGSYAERQSGSVAFLVFSPNTTIMNCEIINREGSRGIDLGDTADNSKILYTYADSGSDEAIRTFDAPNLSVAYCSTRSGFRIDFGDDVLNTVF